MAGMLQKVMGKLNLSSQSKEEPAKEPDHQDVSELRGKYENVKQDHVFQYWDELDVAGKAYLFEQLRSIDPKHVNEITEKALNPTKTDEKDAKPELEPLPASAVASILDSNKDDLEAWEDYGMRLVADNKVGVVLMAGGQGTRLGSSAPKGCYDIGLPSKKSLFQLQAERIIKLQELAASKHGKKTVIVPWYIMTSGPTQQPTKEFFEEHEYFGLDKENVVIFEQGVLPCISSDGKILLEEKSKIAVAPDGNGGLYQAMLLNSVVSDISNRGIEHIHAYCVDNCLVKVADPVFLGFAATKEVDIATKVVRKRNAKESVGLILQKNGKPDVVEYSEMDSSMSEAKDPQDSKFLKFRAANIVNHYYSRSFLETIPEWSHRLPYHVARKKISCMDLDKNEKIKPEKANGIKLEQFVFDCFPFVAMDKFACMEVQREDEFSPLKNAAGTGEDDAESSRRHILDQGRRWLQAVGVVVESENQDSGVEISPLISYAGEGLEKMSGQKITAPAVIEKDRP